MAIKAVIFDCFGVLVRDGWLPFCEKHFGHDTELREQARATNWRVNTGHITYDEYIAENAKLAGIDEKQARAEIESNLPNDALFELIKELKPDYKVAVLSNAAENWLEHLFGRDRAQLFDATLLSYEIQAMKPDPIMYETIAERLDVTPSECLFIDDQQRYCEGAQAIGMEAICYQDNAQLTKKLKNYNIFTKKT